MSGHGSRTFLLRVFVLANALLVWAPFTGAQGVNTSVSTTPWSTGQASDVSLAGLVSDLQRQVQQLNSQLGELRAQEQEDRNETRALRSELEGTAGSTEIQAGSANGSGLYPPYSPPSSLAPGAQAGGPSEDASQNLPTSQRLAKLEEDQRLTDDKVNEQSQ